MGKSDKCPSDDKNGWDCPGGQARVYKENYGLDGFDIGQIDPANPGAGSSGTINWYVEKRLDPNYPSDKLGTGWVLNATPPTNPTIVSWFMQDGAGPLIEVKNGDAVEDGGGANTSSSLSVPPAPGVIPAGRITQGFHPSGTIGDIQYNGNNEFQPDDPAELLLKWNLDQTTGDIKSSTPTGTNSAELQASAFDSVKPAAPDTVYGSTPFVGGDSAFRQSAIRFGTIGQNTSAPFNQSNLQGQGVAPGGYGFPGDRNGVEWLAKNSPVNTLPCCMFRWNQIVEGPLSLSFGGFYGGAWYLVIPCTDVALTPVSNRAFYDPLNLRVINFTDWKPYGFGGTVISGDGMGWNPLSLTKGYPGVLRIDSELSGRFSAPAQTGTGCFQVDIRLGVFDQAGNSKFNKLVNNATMSKSNTSYYLFNTDTFYLPMYDNSTPLGTPGESIDATWEPGDLLMFYMVTSYNDAEQFAIDYANVTVTWYPNA